jgi:hypothetical protein
MTTHDGDSRYGHASNGLERAASTLTLGFKTRHRCGWSRFAALAAAADIARAAAYGTRTTAAAGLFRTIVAALVATARVARTGAKGRTAGGTAYFARAAGYGPTAAAAARVVLIAALVAAARLARTGAKGRAAGGTAYFARAAAYGPLAAAAEGLTLLARNVGGRGLLGP